MARSSKSNRFTQQLFSRPASDGRSVVYVRFIDKESGLVLATRSTGLETGASDKHLKASITSILADLDLESLAIMKDRKRQADLADDERLAAMSVYDFVRWYWSDDGYHVSERKDAGRPLSTGYLQNNRSYTEIHIRTFEAFQSTPVRELRLSIVEAFVRKLRRAKLKRDVIKRTLDALRTPINWAQARGLVASPFTFATLVLPKKEGRERGILSEEEITKILALSYMTPWKADSGKKHLDIRPRPRRKKGESNEGPPMLDVRQKAAITLGLFAGMRRSEIVGLKWGDVDFEGKRIHIRHSYDRFDGEKEPKMGSIGDVPLAPELEDTLKDLRSMCDFLGYTAPSDYVLPGTSRTRPINEIAIRRGWERALELIGIGKDEKTERNLVMHGARHAYTTRLLDSGVLSPAEVAKLTRHRDLSMLSRYGGHTRDETIEKGRKALSLKKEEQDESD